jgi:hypothetical protein
MMKKDVKPFDYWKEMEISVLQSKTKNSYKGFNIIWKRQRE